ncbi:MAG: hypothetical protein ACOYZ8_17835 [Chloroflexota bacterium]
MAEKEKPRRYESEVIVLPPLKMVLVEKAAGGQPRKRKARKASEALTALKKQEAVRRIIEHLIEN